MLVLLMGTAVGCGGNSANQTTVSSPTVKEVVVPDEVTALFERNELAQAIETVSLLIKQSPNDENLLAVRATAHHRLRRHQDAISDLDQAIAINGLDAKLYNNRGFIRLDMAQYDIAQADFDKAIAISPTYKNAYNNLGLLFIAQQRYSDAIGQFNQAIRIDNRYVDAYNNRGYAEFEAGQIEQALDDFNLALQLNPDYVNAYNNRGLLRARVGDYKNAAIDFTRAMMLDPLNPKYYEHRCDVYQAQGLIDAAVADDNKIGWLVEYHALSARVASDTRPVDALTMRAKHFLANGDLDQALADLDRALKLDPRSAPALVARAGIHLQQQSISYARADAEASLSVEPSQEAYSILGEIYLLQKDYDRAIENFAKARRVDPKVAEAYYARSKVLSRLGRNDLAQDNLDQALALDPDVEERLR
jgi:tetratricopeptide (TPR) repeat protein